MAELTVGTGEQYSTISAAVAASHSGDTVAVDAGTYTNDFPVISHSLTLQAAGGTVKMVATQSPPNGKAIIEEGASGANVTITGFDLSGAQVPDGNGAAIRYEGGSLTLSNDTIHDNQDGLLSNADPNGTITISNSNFAHNGTGDGKTHNIYVGEIASLTVQNSMISGAVVGHEIKSRAESTTITGNTIVDGATGTASYDVDLPNGGNAAVTGNVIEKGANAQNPIAISFGEEGNVHGNSALLVQGNTLLNDDTAHSTTVVVNDTNAVATISGNSLYGWSSVASGPASVGNNTTLSAEPALSSLTPDGGTASGSGASGTTATGGTPSNTGNTGSPGMPATPSPITGSNADTAAPNPGPSGSAPAGNTSTGSIPASGTGVASTDGGVPVTTGTIGSSSDAPGFIAPGTSSGAQPGTAANVPGLQIAPGDGAPQILEKMLQLYGIPVSLAQIVGSPGGLDQTGGTSGSQHGTGYTPPGSGAATLVNPPGQNGASSYSLLTSTH